MRFYWPALSIDSVKRAFIMTKKCLNSLIIQSWKVNLKKHYKQNNHIKLPKKLIIQGKKIAFKILIQSKKKLPATTGHWRNGAWQGYFSLKTNPGISLGLTWSTGKTKFSKFTNLKHYQPGRRTKPPPTAPMLERWRYCGGATVRWLLDIIINRGSSWKAEMPGELSLGGETSLLGRDDASQLTEVRAFL